MAKKPDYRLQVLFQIREKAKGEAEELYALRQRELAEQEKILADMKTNLKGMEAARRERKREYAEKLAAGELKITQVTANDRHIDRMKQEELAYSVDIQRQKELLAEFEERVEEAKEAMLQATQDFKALEKHKENWSTEVKRELQLKEEEAVEDISQAQYFKRMKDGL